MRPKIRRITLVLALMAIAVATQASACNRQTNQGQVTEFTQQTQDQATLEANQPVPHFRFSQLRQNLAELETAQATGAQTTSFMCSDFCSKQYPPIFVCPSIGAPIASTTQLTNPDQPIKDNAAPLNNGGGNLTVGQMDPTGVYSGTSTGTDVMCVNGAGQVEPFYWEGFVATVYGPASWDSGAGRIVLTGQPTMHFSK